MEKVYSVDMSGRGETQILNFYNEGVPTEARFEADVRNSLAEAANVSRGWLVAFINKMRTFGYIRIPTVVYDMGADEAYTEEVEES